MASTDYTGRTVDLLIFQGVAEYGKQPVTTGWGTAGQLCTGIQKVAQSWLMLFLTDIGTVLNDPTRGCGFMQAMRFGRIRVVDDVASEFALAASQIQQIMNLDAIDAALPDDEQLAKAALLDYSLDNITSTLRLKIQLSSLAGESRVIYLPVSVSIM